MDEEDENAARLKDMRAMYAAVFLSHEGQIVFNDLAKFVKLTEATQPGTPNEILQYEAGQKSVVLRINTFLAS